MKKNMMQYRVFLFFKTKYGLRPESLKAVTVTLLFLK